MAFLNIKDAAGVVRKVVTTELPGGHLAHHVTVDDRGYVGRIDAMSGSRQIVESSHAKIHEGYSFHASKYLTLGNDVTYDVILATTVGPSISHLLTSILCNEVTEIIFYEGPTFTAGTGLTPVNRNRSSANASGATVTYGVAVSAVGTELSAQSGGGKHTPSEIFARNEWPLAPSTDYLLRIVSRGSTNVVTWIFDWYEHTPSN